MLWLLAAENSCKWPVKELWGSESLQDSCNQISNCGDGKPSMQIQNNFITLC